MDKEDENRLMSQSLVSMYATPYLDRSFGISRGRKRHTELTPALPRERGLFTFSTGRMTRDQTRPATSDSSSVKSTPKRAVSMTRLDQLAQPRRRYLEETLKSNYSLNSGPNESYLCAQNKLLSRSMVQLSARPPPPVRPTKASKLRSQTLSLQRTRSTMSIDSESLSPTRPISSMTSSMDSTEVKRRVKPAVPRKPRPLSIGSPYGIKVNVEDKVEPRESRPERQLNTASHLSVPMRPNRARSAGGALKARPLSLVSPDSDGHLTPKPAPPRKPAHVKAAAMARKAAKQPEVADKPEKPTASEKPITSSETKKTKPTPKPEVVARKAKEVKEQEVIVKVEDIVKQVEPDVSAEVKPDVNIEVEEEAEAESVSSVPSVEPKPVETTPNPVISDNTVMPSNSNTKKEMSEEDYKKMMAEKRRLAREQAEREAEAERLRIEREKQEEEERIRREEEEHRKFEEEQLRLIEEQKRVEEERLRKAMEENRLREEEENRRKAEEQRLKLEREEKDRRAKEEAERQRLELEERLKRDEEERLQRKKKLEAIMSRTRKSGQPARGQSPSNSPNETPEPPQQQQHSNVSTPEKSREVEKNHQNILKNEQKEDNLIIKTNGSDIQQSKPDLVEDVDRAVLQNRKSEQNNGLSHLNTNNINNNNNNNIHIESYRNDNLVSVADTVDNSQPNASLGQLINLSPYPTPTHTSMDDVFDSNYNTSNTYIASNGSTHKNQEQAITDLLS